MKFPVTTINFEDVLATSRQEVRVISHHDNRDRSGRAGVQLADLACERVDR